jgi:hypothetical protein
VVGGQGACRLLACGWRVAAHDRLALRFGGCRSTARSYRASVRLQGRRPRPALLQIQATGTRPTCIGPSVRRPFQRPDIRKRSGMTEGPICARSISPIQTRSRDCDSALVDWGFAQNVPRNPASSPRAVTSRDVGHAASGVEAHVHRSICAAASALRQSAPCRSPHIPGR